MFKLARWLGYIEVIVVSTRAVNSELRVWS